MRLHRFSQYMEIVSSLQAAHQAAAAMRLRHIQRLLRQPDEILDFQSQRTDGVESMRIKTGADQDKLRFDLVRRFLQGVAISATVILARCAVADGDIECVALSCAFAGFVGVAGAGIKAHAEAMDAEK